jgi:transcriptional regulator with XRE-family HTH domain
MDATKTFYSEVGRRIRTERERRGMTQHALASHVSLTRTSLTNIETGKQRFLLHTLIALAAALQISPAALIPGASESHSADLDESLREQPAQVQEWIRTSVEAARREDG